MRNLSVNRKKIIECVYLMLLCLSLYFLSEYSYVLFHTLIEMDTIVLGLTLMLIALGTFKICENDSFHFLAIIFGFASLVDLLHVLTYKGINILFNDSNMSIQISVVAQYYGNIMLNLLLVYVHKKFNWNKIFVISTIFLVLATISITIFKVFPACYVEGQGLTFFHQFSEVIFTLNYFYIFLSVMNSKLRIFKNNKLELGIAIFFQILSYACFILYNNLFGVFSLLGHVFNILAYYFGFKIVFKSIVVNPYTTLFQKLNNKVIELENTNNELNKANYKAQSMEKLNEKFINLIPDGILIIRDKKIESVNNRVLKMFEINEEVKIINKNFTDIIDDSYKEIFALRINKMDGSLLEKPQQYEIIWGGVRKFVEITSLIVSDEQGEHIISAIRNIEDRKKAEETEQILELKKKEEKMKNEFFTNISHELRTPINVIYSALQVENDYLRNDRNEELIVKYNKIIRQNCLRLMRLINNIIDVTRIETSFFKPNYSIENIVAIAEDITMSIIEYIESKNIKLVFDTEIEEAYVKCDSVLIDRIMLNILSNAVKYGKDKGNIEVNICLSHDNNISIIVKDDGIGIPDEMKEKIFDRFLKVDNSLSRKTEGSGIGLSLVKQLVEIQGGTITFDSQLNTGTVFKITFPTVEYYSEACVTVETPTNYHKNIIKSAEIEFSDIYY